MLYAYTVAIEFGDNTIGKNGWTIDIYPSAISDRTEFLKKFNERYSGNGIEDVTILDKAIVDDLNDLINAKANYTVI